MKIFHALFQVCSRYDGSRLLVVRGDKNLDTCGLMEHKLQKKDTMLDVEHSRVKVTYERPAEVLGLVDIDMEINSAKEDLTDDVEGTSRTKNINDLDRDIDLDSSKKNNTRQKHHKRHIKGWRQKVKKLKHTLESKLTSFHSIFPYFTLQPIPRFVSLIFLSLYRCHHLNRNR